MYCKKSIIVWCGLVDGLFVNMYFYIFDDFGDCIGNFEHKQLNDLLLIYGWYCRLSEDDDNNEKNSENYDNNDENDDTSNENANNIIENDILCLSILYNLINKAKRCSHFLQIKLTLETLVIPSSMSLLIGTTSFNHHHKKVKDYQLIIAVFFITFVTIFITIFT